MLGFGLATQALYVSAIIVFLLSIFWRPQIGLYFLVPLLPLQTARYKLFAYPLGNKLVFLIPLAVILGVLLRGGALFPPALPLKRILIIFGFFYFVSLWWGSLYTGAPLPITFDDPRFENWVNYMVMPVLYFLTVCAIRDVKQMKILILLMSLSLLIVDRGFHSSMSGRDLSHFSYSVRDAGPLAGAGVNGFAAFEAEISLFLLALYFFEEKKLIKFGLLALLAGNIYCLLFSYSRGGYAGFLVGLLFLALVKERKLLIGILALLIGWQIFVPASVVERITMTYDDDSGELDSSAGHRLTLWEDASGLIHQNPLFGTGFNTYEFMHRDASLKDTHNYYLKVLVETGLIGFALFLCLLVSAFRLGFRLFRSAQGQDAFLASVGLGFAVMVISSAVVNLFGDRWTFLQVNGYLWTLLACVVRGHMVIQERDEVEVGSFMHEFPAGTHMARV